MLVLVLAACTSATATPEADPTATPPAGIQVGATQPPGTSTPTSPPAATDTISPTPTVTQPRPTPPGSLPLPNVADTVERVRPAVVSVVAEVVTRDAFGTRSGFSSGTGVIIDPQGLVLTNNHVIEGASAVTVTFDDDSQVEAEIVGAHPPSDLAVLRIPGDNHPSLPVDPDVPLRVGDWVIAIGNALALPGGPTVTVGVISALGRSLAVSQDVTLYDLVQTDTVINPGNSGGPLISLQGQLVGINTAILRGGTGSGPEVEGIGFAISMGTAAFISEQLIQSGQVRLAFMGLELGDLTPEIAAEVGLSIREGVVVVRVVAGGPSDQAGIEPNDVILSLDGQKVATVIDLIVLLRQELRVGQEIDVEVFRGDSRETLRLTLGERPQ